MDALARAASPHAAVDAIVDLFIAHGQHRYDEAVTQEHHAVQAAALAEREDGRPAVVAAALLHDVGHLLHADERRGGEPRDRQHEAVGAMALARWFPPEVTAPVALHVAAKRYLCAVDPTYHDRLSAASQLSLRLQGGPLSEADVSRFEELPAGAVAARLRRWDDQAKDPNAPVRPIAEYRDLLRSVCSPRR